MASARAESPRAITAMDDADPGRMDVPGHIRTNIPTDLQRPTPTTTNTPWPISWSIPTTTTRNDRIAERGPEPPGTGKAVEHFGHGQEQADPS